MSHINPNIPIKNNQDIAILAGNRLKIIIISLTPIPLMGGAIGICITFHIYPLYIHYFSSIIAPLYLCTPARLDRHPRISDAGRIRFKS